MNSVTELLFGTSIILVAVVLIWGLIRSFLKSRRLDEVKLLAVLARHPNGLSGPDLAKIAKIDITRFQSAATRLERSKSIDSYFKLEIIKVDKPRLRIYVATTIGRQQATAYNDTIRSSR